MSRNTIRNASALLMVCLLAVAAHAAWVGTPNGTGSAANTSPLGTGYYEMWGKVTYTSTPNTPSPSKTYTFATNAVEVRYSRGSNYVDGSIVTEAFIDQFQGSTFVDEQWNNVMAAAVIPDPDEGISRYATPPTIGNIAGANYLRLSVVSNLSVVETVNF